ncbi:MAG: class I SAM-dependent DNA methyltransferase [Actinomycetota bacterium]
MATKTRRANNGNGVTLGFEATLWAAADKLRGHMDAAEYKHVVLGLIFLKYISDAFDARHEALAADPDADPEDPDEYLSSQVFWVPPEARWLVLQDAAKTPEIGVKVDAAMDAIERDNVRLKGVLPKDYARPTLDKTRLGELIDLIGTIAMREDGDRSKDVLGRVYEYFLGQFASKEGKKAGEFYTPRCIVRLLVEMIEPYQGRVYDPCCGSAGMFVQSEEFLLAHGGKLTDLSVYGQESNPTTWKLAQMNLAIRGIEANLGSENADTFTRDLHPDLKADFILANPPFNMKDWGGERLKDDVRWVYGTPPTGNANFAWVQHFIHHLAPDGIAGFVLSNGSMSSTQSGEGAIRAALVEADLVDCMVALPGQLFYGTAIPACLWFVARDRSGKPTRGGKPLRNRRGEALFIDARQMGEMVSRVHRELTDDDIATIARTYHSWRGEEGEETYSDTPGFSRGVAGDELRQHAGVLTPGRYVGAVDLKSPDEPFDVAMTRLITQFDECSAQADRLRSRISGALSRFSDG